MTDDVERELERLWGDGVPTALMSLRVGMAPEAIRVYAHRHRDRFPKRRPGQYGGYPESLHKAARKCAANGLSCEVTGRLLGISRQTAWRWRREDG